MQTIAENLALLATGRPLPESDAYSVFSAMLTGQVDPAQIGALLAFIASRSPSVDELVGGARAMRDHVTRVPLNIPGGDRRVLIDTCGTGGAPKTFNVSTIGAIVTAAAAPGRVLVAKHGSVSRTGRGSAEVMRALGVNVASSPESQARCLNELGVCFSFAQHHHPAMKHVAPIRKALAFPTIFNLLGPLTNPAGATRQLIGTYNQSIASKLAETLLRLGAEKAMVVTSLDGLDELTLTATTSVRLVERGVIGTFRIDPLDYAMPRCSLEDLQVDSLEHAAIVFRGVLSNDTTTPDPKKNMVVLNAGAALVVAGVTDSIAAGVELAREAIRSGRALRVLDSLIRLSNESS